MMTTTCSSADSDIVVLSGTCYRLLRSWPRNWLQVSPHPQCIAAAISAANLQAFEFQCTRSLAPEKPELPQVHRLETTPVTYQGVAGAVAARKAVVPYLSPHAVHWWRHTGSRRGERHREDHTEHGLLEPSHTAVAGQTPAFAHRGRNSRKAVARSRDGGVALDPPSGSGVRIRRQNFFKPTRS